MLSVAEQLILENDRIPYFVYLYEQVKNIFISGMDYGGKILGQILNE